jgi:hypothetical protein
MHTIRMVSDGEGEKLRGEETMRQERIKTSLVGAKIVDLVFSGVGITNHSLKGLTIEKDDVRYNIEIEAEMFYDCITKKLIVTNEQTREEMT